MLCIPHTLTTISVILALLLLPIPLSLLQCIFMCSTFSLLQELLLAKVLAHPATNANPSLLSLLSLLLLQLLPTLLLLQLNYKRQRSKSKSEIAGSSKNLSSKYRNPTVLLWRQLANSATSVSIIANDAKPKRKKILTWLTALHEWNSQKDLTGSFISLLLFLCGPRRLTWLCVTNKSKGISKACQNRVHSTQSLQGT